MNNATFVFNAQQKKRFMVFNCLTKKNKVNVIKSKKGSVLMTEPFLD
ncbi:hypothetical protein LV85_02021 [Algoriphagus chordae]|uniref:Uncharacterized protein n=1 Tax=Algoriphagus chordae TaxID=237019 RepID=A0A2W7RES6_9BACT|nr:hypothetical protein LV85_02021 [Algoriphagus chordae]